MIGLHQPQRAFKLLLHLGRIPVIVLRGSDFVVRKSCRDSAALNCAPSIPGDIDVVDALQRRAVNRHPASAPGML